jgi:hypothetical protein
MLPERLWPVLPQKRLQERRQTDGLTQQMTLYIRFGYKLSMILKRKNNHPSIIWLLLELIIHIW